MRKPIHTTISDETSRYLDRMAEKFNISKGQMVDWLVEQQKKHETGIEKSIVKEVVHMVLTDYYKREIER